ncbi:MAG: DUF58 domain-containing protein [Candidatus Eremiobacteraeota bacterium]|nr:DUF58 domain-containing protein [Candidatus Eremiobacteraeota bacterium]
MPTGSLRTALLRGRNRPRIRGTGSPTVFRGDGYEFAELREYVAGDDPRRIDWAATARVGALQTRVVLEDVALTLAAIIDDSGSMQIGRARCLLDSAGEALRAWYRAALTDDRCARITDRGLVAPLALRGTRSALVCEHADSHSTHDLPRAMDIARVALPRGSALLVVSDLFDIQQTHERLLGELGRRFDCTVLFAQDPWDGRLPLGGFVRLADAESGRQQALFVGPRERQAYAQAVQMRTRAMRAQFERSGWRFGTLREDDGVACLHEAFGLQ